MSIISQCWLVIALLLSTALLVLVEPVQHDGDHIDELKVNPSLQFHYVLEKTIARNPMQVSLTSREFMVSAKSLVVNAMLPSIPALNVLHQNDALGCGSGEREWQAELELSLVA